MKRIVVVATWWRGVLALALACGLGLCAGDGGRDAPRFFGKSPVTNDVFAIVGGAKTGFFAEPNKCLTTDEYLVVAFLTVLTNNLHFCPPVDPALRAEITLRSENGKAVAKTKLGRSFGTRFAELTNFWDGTMHSAYADSMYNSNVAQGHIPASSFPSVEKCFKVSKPGKYYLTIRLQGFRRPLSGPGDVRFVRFPPFDVPVYKEQE